MSTGLSSTSKLRLVLVSTGPTAHVAVASLVQHLGLSAATALARLTVAPSVLAEGIAPDVARDLAGLLRALGLRVRLDGAPEGDARLDLSIQLSAPVRIQRTIRIVAEQTGISPVDVDMRLGEPGGLVLSGLRPTESGRLRRVLERSSNLVVIESDPASAVYDAFLKGAKASPDLTDRLRLMGAQPDPITGAVAAGLDLPLCQHLRNRVEQGNMIVLDRAFQRYDLFLSRVTGWVTQDLADFLVARTGLPRCRFEVISDDMPLRIETGLTHAAARQFRADYASIGLHTFLALTASAATGMVRGV